MCSLNQFLGPGSAAIIAATAFGLAACGGGGGGGQRATPAAAPQPVYYQVAAADFDADGLVDLAALVRLRGGSGASVSPELRVLLQRSDRPGRFAVFQRLPLPSFQGAVAAADLDGDGRTDIVVTDELGNSVRIYLQNPADSRFGLTGTATAIGPASIEIADLDLDGAPDLVMATARGVRALRQDAASPGTFPERLSLDIESSLDPMNALPSSYDSLAVGDLDHDGLVDVVTVREDGQALLYRQDQAIPGTFLAAEPVALDLALAGTVAIADLDQDGYDDLVVAGAEGGPVFVQPALRVRRQDPQPPHRLLPVYPFDLTDEGEPQRLALADVTGDGLPDVVVAKLYRVDNGLVEALQQIGPPFGLQRLGVFAALTLAGLEPNLQGLAVADLNADGLADVAVTDGELSVLFNDRAEPGRLLPPVAVASP